MINPGIVHRVGNLSEKLTQSSFTRQQYHAPQTVASCTYGSIGGT
jgi:hypothetical protein